MECARREEVENRERRERLRVVKELGARIKIEEARWRIGYRAKG